MIIAVSGSTGLIGRQLTERLADDGHITRRVVRTNPGEQDILWSTRDKLVDHKKLNGLDAVIHLAGEGIASGRWSDKKKKRIRDSRVVGTRLLCDALARIDRPPQVLIAASAIGFYGDRGSEICTEDSPPGTGFLPDVCTEWELATDPARRSGIRVVNLRISTVLSREGGALAKLLPLFRCGLGGRLGSGQQYFSWIALSDLIELILFCLTRHQVQGPINGVAPYPVTNHEFTQALAKTLRRPALIPAPAFALRLVLGEMADALLLASTRVEPQRLLELGFNFEFRKIVEALAGILNPPRTS